jgi:CRP-like cAMP-binding protein
LLSTNANGKPIQIGEIGVGECFGDQLTAGASVSDIDILAIEDLKIMVFEDEVIGDLLNQSPVLADEIGDAIELRRQAAQAARRMRG